MLPEETITIVVKALLELAASQTQSEGGFQAASQVQTDTEDLLVDGAIDQTFAFQRSHFI